MADLYAELERLIAEQNKTSDPVKSHPPTGAQVTLGWAMKPFESRKSSSPTRFAKSRVTYRSAPVSHLSAALNMGCVFSPSMPVWNNAALCFHSKGPAEPLHWRLKV